MRSHRSDPLDFVRGNGYTETGAADEQRAVGFTFCDETGGGGGASWVGGFVRGVVGADVDYFGDAVVGFEVFLEGVFVADAGVLGRSAFTLCPRLENGEGLHHSSLRSSSWVPLCVVLLEMLY